MTTSSPRLTLDFSDGVRSITRTVSGLRPLEPGFRARLFHETRTRLGQALAARALRAVGGIVGLDRQIEQRERRNAEIDRLTAHDRCPRRPRSRRCARRRRALRAPNRRSSRRPRRRRRDRSARKRTRAARPAAPPSFSTNIGERSELARDLVAENDPADRRAHDDRRRVGAGRRGQLRRKRFDQFRDLRGSGTSG